MFPISLKEAVVRRFIKRYMKWMFRFYAVIGYVFCVFMSLKVTTRVLEQSDGVPSLKESMVAYYHEYVRTVKAMADA